MGKLAIALFALAQIKAQDPSSIIGAWDATAQIKSLAERAKSLDPVLAAVKPEEWMQKGAPEAYVRQLQSTQLEMRNLVASADRFAQRPEQLSTALDTYFLMQSMEQLAGSLSQGVRKYQSNELADQLTQALTSNALDRDQLKSYIIDLAKMREQELRVANEEAQRCRAMISRQSEPPRRHRQPAAQSAPVQPTPAPKAQ